MGSKITVLGIPTGEYTAAGLHCCMFPLCQAEEAQDQYTNCVADAGVRRMDLANAKSTILTQIREMVFQCDLTLKAVSEVHTTLYTTSRGHTVIKTWKRYRNLKCNMQV